MSQKKSPSSVPEADTRHLVKDLNHYLDDGNIVVLVKDTMFKIYRGLISKHSLAISKMLEPPFLIEVTDIIDGTPVLNLSNTHENITAEEFSLTLNIIMDVVDENPSMREVTAILKVSTELEFPKAQKWAKNAMLRLVPTTLVEWKKNQTFFKESYTQTSWIVFIGQRYELPAILPLALYYLGAMDWSREMTLLITSDLQDRDYQAILRGKSRCRQRALELLSVLPEFGLRVLPPPCGVGKECKGLDSIPEAKRGARIAQFLNDPLSFLGVVSTTSCRKCKQLRSDSLRDFFKQLPEMFQVEMAPDVPK